MIPRVPSILEKNDQLEKGYHGSKDKGCSRCSSLQIDADSLEDRLRRRSKNYAADVAVCKRGDARGGREGRTDGSSQS